ncbi:urease subunit alpha [Helicobacter mustelae]|uniref:urease n=1 Tax=Helicobacter mustelae (strain ATCC 43772 / CCUG 25715 / CIP 103759 / LMG 18044 / NCTC 12198 / R85-136P) TaxID=679897 RepID=D3UJ81_HELM1|nr:urease subunit alpha [Helicobacter mustelae]CBG40556.1 putative fusion of urease beta and gamma subunits [Helicobacter mustelae 12198]SQH72053.1 urease subunits beta and gamma [Helicobacter mustelae]STP13196.1 urease subunits beta and gamma [Helicobacter mustelae]
MKLTPKEQEKFLLYYAGEVARKRKEEGLKLNQPEAIAYISAHIMDEARRGKKTVAQLMEECVHFLKKDEVMPGVGNMVPDLGVEANFPDGTKLVTVNWPIEPDDFKAGEIKFASDKDIELNAGKEITELKVTNKGPKSLHVGSHFHFFEANRALEFDREKAYGKRLDIPSGNTLRIGAGETKTVHLIPIGGSKKIIGMNGLLNGIADDLHKQKALEKAKHHGFIK